jgi:hypothetical protein
MSGGPGIPATRGELATLWVDEPTAAFNVGLLCRFAAGPFSVPGGGLDVAAVRAEVARRALRVPALRRRLTTGRRPVWIEDEPFHPERHVQVTQLPVGQELLDWCAGRILEPLDRGAPLWRVDVVPLPPGEFALLLVAHHALADGRTGAAVLRGLLDALPVESTTPPRPTAPPPGPAERRAGWRRLRDAVGSLRLRAPVTSFSGPVGPHRGLAEIHADLAGVRAAAAGSGATVNDVLLAAVTAGLRELLAARGDRVEGLVLRASVPVSSGAADQPDGMLLVSLPVGEPDPVRRLATVSATTSALKSRLRSGGGTVFDVLRLPTPLARFAVRRLRRLAGRTINLFVTDVQGPATPLRLAGARLLAVVPVAPLTGFVPLGVAAFSCAGTLHIGINADGAITDLAVLRNAMAREFATLAVAGRERHARPSEERSHQWQRRSGPTSARVSRPPSSCSGPSSSPSRRPPG